MAKLTLLDVTSGRLTSIANINSNNTLIETALENTLSRDGTAPNQMEADFDVNSNYIINVPLPLQDNHAANKQYVDLLFTDAGGGDLSFLQTQITANRTDIDTNTGNITTNTASVTTNATAIATNTTAVATLNTTVAANTTSITNVENDVSTLTTTVTTNTADISTNTAAVTTLTSSVASLSTSVTANTTSIATNTSGITTLQTDVTNNTANITTNATAITGLNSSVATLTTSVSSNTTQISTNTSDISDNVMDINANASAITSNTASISTNATAITNNTSAIATNTTTISAVANTPRINLIPARYQVMEEADHLNDPNFALRSNATFLGTGIQNPYTSTDGFKFSTSAADGRIAFTPDIGDSYFTNLGDRANVLLESGSTYALRMNVQIDSGATNFLLAARGADDGSFTPIATESSPDGTNQTLLGTWSPPSTQEYSFEFRVLSPSGTADNWIYRTQLVEVPAGTAATDVPYISSAYSDERLTRAQISRVDTAVADETSARVSADTTLQANIDGVSASVTTNASAVADIEGNLTARFGIAVDGGGNGSFISLEDGTSTPSTITLTASQINLNGDVIVDGTITTTEIASGAVTTVGVDETDGALTPSNNVWTDVASVNFTSQGIGVVLSGSVDIDLFMSAGSVPIASVRLLRDSTVLKTSQAYIGNDAGSGFVRLSTNAFIQTNDIPSSGTYDYKLQVRFSEGTSATLVTDFDATNRSLTAIEYKR